MHLNELKLFDASKTDLYFSYFHELGIETKKTWKILICLEGHFNTERHRQAAFERSFSLCKSSIQATIIEETIKTKKTTKSFASQQGQPVFVESSSQTGCFLQFSIWAVLSKFRGES